MAERTQATSPCCDEIGNTGTDHWAHGMIRSFAIGLAMLTSLGSWATHVLGGEMFYDKLSGNQYRITLKIYRDCGPGNTNNTGFDANLQLAVYNGAGAFQFSQDVAYPGELTVPVDLSNPCLAAPPSICARWAEYVTILNLPPNSNGYVVSYQRCCRTPTTINLPTGVLQGLTCTVQIPPVAALPNSSPRFVQYPPVALCMGEALSFDHSATDPDGDDLVYDLFTPWAGGTATDPAPLAGPPPYVPIQWALGYTAGNPVDGAPPLMIDPATGELTVLPTLLGSFAVGVRVREYRNGQYLSESIRDFRFDVVPCETTIVSVIQEQQEFCSGLTIDFENQSTNGDFWHWDFGVEGTDADTSDLAEPQWTYAEGGTYTITLIANPGWPCADTSISVFDVHAPLQPTFARPPIRCPNEPAEFVAIGPFTAAAQVGWEFEGDASPIEAQGISVSAAFNQLGASAVRLTVEEFGCTEIYVDSVVVFPRIATETFTDSAGCIDGSFGFVGGAAAWTPLRYRWDLGDGTVVEVPSVEHQYGAPGVYDVSFTASTDEGCVDEAHVAFPDRVSVYPRPVADFVVEPDEVSLMDPRIEVKDRSQLAADLSYVIDGTTFTQPSFSYEFQDAGRFDITQVVTSGYNCSDAITHTVFVTDHLFYAPNAFTPDGDGLNDTFAPVVRGAREYEIVIVDRWGVERFRSTDPKAAWTGDGLPQGTYTYIARIAEHGAFSKDYSGHVTLLR